MLEDSFRGQARQRARRARDLLGLAADASWGDVAPLRLAAARLWAGEAYDYARLAIEPCTAPLRAKAEAILADPFEEIAARIAARKASIQRFVAGGARPFRVPAAVFGIPRVPTTAEFIVHRSTVAPGKWQASRFENGAPTGHLEGEFERIVTRMVEDYGVILP